MTEKLKPCPFCGGKAEACQTYDGFFWKVMCCGCGNCTLKYVNKEQAIDTWNRRTESEM